MQHTWPKVPVHLEIPAPAKLNIWLLVGPKLSNGYHEIRSLMVPLTLEDRIDLWYKPGELKKTNLLRHADSTDLAWRALAWWVRRIGTIPGEVTVGVDKHIPMASGLGGGSSDAAAVLRGLCHLARRRPEELASHALVELGSDVPFCLLGRPALVSGQGERLQPTHEVPWGWSCVVWPRIPVSTRRAFEWLDADRGRSVPLGHLAQNPEPGHNDFWAVLSRRYPKLRQLHTFLRDQGAQVVGMSGSGSCLFGLFLDEATSRRAAKACVEFGWSAWSAAIRHRPPSIGTCTRPGASTTGTRARPSGNGRRE